MNICVLSLLILMCHFSISVMFCAVCVVVCLCLVQSAPCCQRHEDVIKWKHFPIYWPFVRGIHYSPVNSPHKCQWRGALMFSLISAWINGWVNNREARDLRRHRTHYDVTVTYSNILRLTHPNISCYCGHRMLLSKITDILTESRNAKHC